MLNAVSEDYPVSVVANPLVTMELFKEFMMCDNVELALCDIDNYGYDKEYVITLSDDSEFGLELSVDKAYYGAKDIYLSTGGLVLFHENVPSKALLDMKGNEYTEFDYDWFVFDCDEEGNELETKFKNEFTLGCHCDHEGDGCAKCNTTLPSDYTEKYLVNGKEVDAETYGKALEEINARLNSFENTFRRFMRLI